MRSAGAVVGAVEWDPASRIGPRERRAWKCANSSAEREAKAVEKNSRLRRSPVDTPDRGEMSPVRVHTRLSMPFYLSHTQMALSYFPLQGSSRVLVWG